MIQEIKLSDEYSIYKTKYDWECSKESFINRIEQLKKFKSHYQLQKKNVHIIDEKHFYFLFNCKEFESINQFILKCSSQLLQQPIMEWALENWVYVVNNDPKDLKLNNLIDKGSMEQEWHTHPTVYVDYQPITTDFTFVFYIQMPTNLNGIEGNIGFRTKDSETFILPEEGDVILFPGTLEHTPVGFLENKDKERLLIAGNVSLNPLKKFDKKNLL
jgi:hypothetical protein